MSSKERASLSAQRINEIREDWISSRKDKNRIEWGLP
jgi:hypothetical protein